MMTWKTSARSCRPSDARARGLRFEFFTMDKQRKTIVVGVTGSIAAYKAADLVSKLAKRGHDIFVVMTHGAQEFVGALTFQTLSKNPVMTSVFGEKESWRPGHIDL